MNLAALLQARWLHLTNRRLSRADFEERRLRRFRRFARFLQQHSPYYARVMQEHGLDPHSCAPDDFPVLTKTEVMRNFDDIVTDRAITRHDVETFLHESHDPRELFRGRYIVLHTSGSSGEVGYFLFDQKAWSHAMANLLSTDRFQIIPLRRQRVAFVGATQGHFAGVSITLAGRTGPFGVMYPARTFEVNRPLAETIAGLNDWQPHLVTGYGTALKELAEKQCEGKLKIHPEAAFNSGEPLVEADRLVIERAFDVPVRNTYSSSEHLFMGMKEPGWKSMRLLEDNLIFEFSGDHILVTNLFNRALPLIRYRMGDILKPLASDEHKPYLAIADVEGRVEQVARFLNRDRSIDGISPHTINEILIPRVRRFQMRLLSDTSFELAVVLEDGISPEQQRDSLASARERLAAILREKALDNVTFEVVPVSDLPIDPKTGKFRLILNQAEAQGRLRAG